MVALSDGWMADSTVVLMARVLVVDLVGSLDIVTVERTAYWMVDSSDWNTVPPKAVKKVVHLVQMTETVMVETMDN